MLGVEHVPHRPRRWAEPGTADPGQPSGPGAPRAGRARPQPSVELGYHRVERTRKGQWYKLYVVLDIFSRYVPGWLAAHAEDAVVAKDFLADAVARNLVIPHTIHADRGGSMTSKPVAEMMINLGICRSHSRPRTSNDNPFSEAQFKTLKYVPDFPDRFGSLADAREFCDRFFPAYNHEHRHSGIGMHTPASIHYGTATDIRARRQATLTVPTHNTPSGSAAGPTHRACPSRRGSANPPSNSQPSKIHCLI